MEYQTVDTIKTCNERLFYVLEKEYNNSLKGERYYYVARSSIQDDPRLTSDLIDIKKDNINITEIIKRNIDYEIIKVSTLFYIINDKTDVLGWQYGLILEDEKESEEEWTSNCISKNVRQRLWLMQISFPAEHDEVCEQTSYNLSNSFKTLLLYSNESVELCQNSIIDIKKSGKIDVY